MTNNTLLKIKQIKTLIAQKGIKNGIEALQALPFGTDTTAQNQIIQFTQQYNTIKQQELHGTISLDTRLRLESQLTDRLLQWLDSFGEQTKTTLLNSSDNSIQRSHLVPTAQGLSHKTYIRLVLGSLLIGTPILMLLIFYPNMLNRASNLVTFTVLSILGLAVAAVLFGIMHSYASIKKQTLSIAINVLSPMIIFFIVLFAGYQSVELDNTPFSYSINLEVQGITPPNLYEDLHNDSVAIKLGEFIPRPIFNGFTAYFPEIPSFYKDKKIAVKLLSDYWEVHPDSDTILLDSRSSNTDIIIQRNNALSYVKGVIVEYDKDNRAYPVEGVQVLITQLSIKDTTNVDGEFNFKIPVEQQAKNFHINISKKGYKHKLSIPISPRSFNGETGMIKIEKLTDN